MLVIRLIIKKMKILVIMLLLLLGVYADDQVVIDCFGCYGSSICSKYKGGGFGDGSTFLMAVNSCA